MNSTSALNDSTVSHFPLRIWTEFAILGLGLPAAIWLASKLIKLSIPAATHGSPAERFLWWIAGPAIAEWLFVLGVVLVLRHRQRSLKDIGVWRVGNWKAWVMALPFAALSIGGNLRFLPRMGIPISAAFFPQGFHLAAALMMGITAGFCEEVMFRGYIQKQFLAWARSDLAAVLLQAIVFGAAHSYQGARLALVITVYGMMFGVLAAWRKNLRPGMMAHAMQDTLSGLVRNIPVR